MERDFCRTAQFLRNFCSIASGRKGSTSNGQRDNVILMEKGADTTPSRQFVDAFSRQKYTAERCGAVLSLKLIGRPAAGHFYIHMLLLSARFLVTGLTHNSEAQALFRQIITRNDLCKEFAVIS